MNYRISKAFQISNEPTIIFTISTTCEDKEGKKTPLHKNATFQTWIYPLLDLKSIHHAFEFY
jgi:hypothetical protein